MEAGSTSNRDYSKELMDLETDVKTEYVVLDDDRLNFMDSETHQISQ